jgi:hypothetical protein
VRLADLAKLASQIRANIVGDKRICGKRLLASILSKDLIANQMIAFIREAPASHLNSHAAKFEHRPFIPGAVDDASVLRFIDRCGWPPPLHATRYSKRIGPVENGTSTSGRRSCTVSQG